MSLASPPPRGRLTLVGIGIVPLRQTTLEALQHIRRADVLWHLVATDLAASWLESENPRARPLDDLLTDDRHRLDAYRAMAEALVAPVREGLDVCGVFYGHPGVFVDASHRAVALCRAEGLDVQMLAGVSAEACAYADLGIDPSRTGTQTYEATDLIVHRRPLDPAATALIWQIGVIGWSGPAPSSPRPADPGLALLADVLAEAHPREHEVIVYEAACHPSMTPRVERVAIGALPSVSVGPMSTLVVPPSRAPVVDPERLARLTGSTSSSGSSASSRPTGSR